MDDFDYRLIKELGKDAKQNSVELSHKLGTSATTVRRRLKNLEKQGITQEDHTRI